MNPDAVIELLKSALTDFLQRDSALLATAAHERSISHRIAVYLEQRLRAGSSAWRNADVDCEYNRVGRNGDPKHGPEHRPIFLDINVHKRGEMEANYLVCEAKFSRRSDESQEKDRSRLRWLTRGAPDPLRSFGRYEWGAFLILDEEGITVELYPEGIREPFRLPGTRGNAAE